ncbi:hypothetical protein [Streptomyces niveus]|uniref:hypothetical protein n=1 Tax=Streptomyces niveus TaxID=193462 RepID=UPI0036A2430F
MEEWTDPRYADVVARYRAAKAVPVTRSARSKSKKRGDPFVVVVDPATLKPYTASR